MTLPRRLVALLMLAALAACAPRLAPPGPGPAAPAFTDRAFLTADGLALPLRRWLPEGPPRGVVLALHGFNDYAKAFDAVPGAVDGTGPFLAARGFAVYAYDQRGFGAAPHAGLWPGRAALVGDARDAAAVVRRMHPGLPVYGLGESMGGAVLMVAAAEGAAAPPFDALVLAAPAVWGRATMPLFYRAGLWLGARFAPGLTPSGRGLGRQASDNIALLRANARDPLFIKNTRIDAIAGLTDLMDQALAAAGRLRVPTLYLYGRHDQIIPSEPTRAAVRAAAAAGGGRFRFALYDGGWHIVLRDRQAAVVLADVAAFLADPAAPLPSGADQGAAQRLAAPRPRAK